MRIDKITSKNQSEIELFNHEGLADLDKKDRIGKDGSTLTHRWIRFTTLDSC